LADTYTVIWSTKDDKTGQSKDWGEDQEGAWADYMAKQVEPNVAVMYQHWIDLPMGGKTIADAWAWNPEQGSEQAKTKDETPVTDGNQWVIDNWYIVAGLALVIIIILVYVYYKVI